MGVVVPEVVGCRDHHFPFPHTKEFSLGTNFCWNPSIFLEPLPCQMGPISTPDYTTVMDIKLENESSLLNALYFQLSVKSEQYHILW